MRLALSAGAMVALLAALCLIADPTIYHDVRGDFVSWNLGWDIGWEKAERLGLDPRAMWDESLYDLGLQTVRNWRIALACTYVLSLVSTLLLFVDRHALVRVAAFASFLVFSTAVYTYQQFDTRFTPALVGLILSEAGTADEYVPIVVGTALRFVALAVLVLLAVRHLARRYVGRVRTAYAIAAATLTLASTVWIAIDSRGVVTNSSPLFKVPAAFAIHGLFRLTLEVPEREAVYFEKTEPARTKNIVMLIDESVTGRYLQLNGFRMPNTPILADGSIELFNFGDASSVYSFTEYSHQLLESGVRLEQLPDYDKRIYALPSIFQYAKSAGFSTAFVDGQYSDPKHTRNPIVQETDYVRFIDVYVSMKEKHGDHDPDTDYRIADEILALLDRNRGSHNLIYAFKQGLHVPFDLRYPRSRRVFTPTLEGGEWAPDKEVESMNSYSNGILWSVDGLLDYLVKGLREREIEDTVVVYTSDHANRQNFGGVGQFTEHFSVPLLIFPVKIADDLRQELSAASRLNRDRISHVDIFPSMLVLMGYDRTLVNRYYGRTVFDYMGTRARTVFDGDIFGSDGDRRLEIMATDGSAGPAGAAVDLSDIFGSAPAGRP